MVGLDDRASGDLGDRMSNIRKLACSAAILCAGLAAAGPLSRPAAALTVAPDFAAFYTATSLGSVSGLPTNYGGLVFKSGDPNKILIGGSANSASGGLYEVPVTRGAGGHIIGVGAATLIGPAPYNDGGFAYGPGNVLLLSRWPVNELGQYKPGSTSPDKVVNLAPLGVAGSHAALNFVPTGFGGAGQLKGVSWSGGEFYTFAFAPDGSGTFDITAATLETTLGGGPEGFVYIDGANAGLGGDDSLLVSEYSAGKVAVYDIDGDGNPILATRRDFITGLTGAEGAAIDPVTGDFLFSTFGGANQLVVVQGFIAPEPPPETGIPEPASFALFGTGLVSLAILRRRRRA